MINSNIINKIDDKYSIFVSHQPDLESYLKNIGILVHLKTADYFTLNL